MSAPPRCRASLAAALLLLLALSACGDDITEPSPDGIAGSPNDPCRLLTQDDANRILGRSDVRPGAAAAQDECSFDTPDGGASLVYDLEDMRVFNLALQDARVQRATVAPVTGVGDQAFYYTPTRGAEPGAPPITYLKVRRRSMYVTTLVRVGERYNLDLEKRVAQKILTAA